MPTKPQTVKRWYLFCEPCSHKQIIQGNDPCHGLTQMKMSPVPGGSPRYDEQEKKTVIKKTVPRLPYAKCPKCGRACVIKKLPDVYNDVFQSIDEDEKKKKEEAERLKRIEDGAPIKVDKDTKFIG